jgi:hypothetical protein
MPSGGIEHFSFGLDAGAPTPKIALPRPRNGPAQILWKIPRSTIRALLTLNSQID